MKRSPQRQAGERGATFLLVMVLGTAVLGIAGLALDGGQLYVTKRRAQAAADSAAQAGVMDLYRGNGSAAASASAIAYGQKNGFAASEIDPQYLSCSALDWCNGHVTLSGVDDPNLIQVTVTRVANTIFLRALGVNLATVRAVGTAAIAIELQPVPILVLHPTMSGSFSKNGGNTIKICGGPPRSIQVNSTSPTSISISGVSGKVDLSKAGPLDSGNCLAGTGADFANVGAQASFPGTLLLGSKPGNYVSPASPIKDPLLGVSPPSKPANAPPPTNLPNGASGCPASPAKPCVLYSPGNYPTGIKVQNETGVFKPGIYYMSGGGFANASNGQMLMATGFTDATTGWTGNMLVYNTGGGTFDIGSNASATLVGSPSGSTYKGILFFQDHGTATILTHRLGGNGCLSLKGTIYLTHTAASINSDGKYQALLLQGTPCSGTAVEGEIIVDALSMGGNSDLTMNLNSAAVFPVRQVALVR